MQVSRQADKRVSKIAREQSDRFESEILANSVHDHVLQDDELARVVEIVEELDELQYQIETDSQLCQTLQRARYDLETDQSVVNMAVERSVDAALEDVAESIDEWDGDVWADEEKQAATDEIRAFWSDGEAIKADD
ncbi:hypothetical protein [Natrinema salifodinae]|uniref:Uncharacterized protein n=1 Tax=Natrinema salifodinae TaxID=1202768 RepID=A0A1I0P7G0_9EURY|nr:hypothetical protein [Natrinema salifodinae]SEW10031.1 hypothetical protein SAMN05216285_2215 [Natrinema salifodinae]